MKLRIIKGLELKMQEMQSIQSILQLHVEALNSKSIHTRWKFRSVHNKLKEALMAKMKHIGVDMGELEEQVVEEEERRNFLNLSYVVWMLTKLNVTKLDSSSD